MRYTRAISDSVARYQVRRIRCPVRHPVAARNLSLCRSLAIFLFQRQTKTNGGKQSLPDYERHVHCKPWGLICRSTQRRHED